MKEILINGVSNVFLAMISGVFVFLISQLINKMHIKPSNDFKEIKGKVISYIVMYQRYIANPLCLYDSHEKKSMSSEYWDVSCKLRMVASEFSGHLECYSLKSNKRRFNKVVNDLMRLSNNIVIQSSKRNIVEENEKLVDEIYQLFRSK